MSGGNTYGRLFRVTTFGESHGPAIGLIIDGVPPRVPFDEARLTREMQRRKPGQSALVTQRKEEDTIQVLSGVFEGVTTGTPLAMVIHNQDQRSKDYGNIKDVFRPGHADFTYTQKYGIRDYRGGGRSSARETACRVAAGAVAAMILDKIGVDVWAYTVQVGTVQGNQVKRDFIEENPVRCADPDAVNAMINTIEQARKEGDSVGAIVEIRADGVPPGIGEPAFDRLDADLAKAIFSIPAIKGVEIGSGFAGAATRGSQNNDAFEPGSEGAPPQTTSNNHGGILGGISSGMPIVLRAALKPTSSIVLPQQTVDVDGNASELQIKGRHDPCVAPRFVPVAEAMVRLTILDHLLRQKALTAFAGSE